MFCTAGDRSSGGLRSALCGSEASAGGVNLLSPLNLGTLVPQAPAVARGDGRLDDTPAGSLGACHLQGFLGSNQ